MEGLSTKEEGGTWTKNSGWWFNLIFRKCEKKEEGYTEVLR